MTTDSDFTLVVRRTVAAPAARVFSAWTRPELLVKWWGPPGVRCPTAEVDLRIGGAYRIVNQLPDGTLLEIAGQFVEIVEPHRLVYTWRLGPAVTGDRVTVLFEPKGDATEIVIRHEHLPSELTREEHGRGWEGCLDGLERLLGGRA